MQNLSIKAGNRTITVDIKGGDMSIDLGDTAALPPDVPAITAGELEWSPTLCDGEAVDFDDAEAAVAKLGEGWRLPTRQELESLLDLSRHDPAIDTDKFPDTKSNYYWTATPCAWNAAARWVVDFHHGYVSYLDRASSACVRAVRAGQ